MPKVKKYKRAKKPRKRINKSIYKSNINKQHVKVNVNTGSTPGISHMNLPAYPNLTDINSTIKGTFNDVLNDFIKTQSQPKSQQSQQQQPYSSNNTFTPTNYNRSQFGEIFNNISSEPRQNPIILQPDEFSFQGPPIVFLGHKAKPTALLRKSFPSTGTS